MATTATPPDYDDLWTDVYGDIQRVGPVHRHMRRRVSAWLAGLDYASVLDVGCGPAENYPLLAAARRLDRFGGIDISRVALDQARRRVPSGEFWNVDIQREGVPGRWDLVHCSLVLEHLPDDVAALTHLRSMTARFLLLTTIGGDFERYRRYETTQGHVRNYAKGELESKVSAAGFRILEKSAWGFPFYSPIARRLLAARPVGVEASFGPTTRLLAEIAH
ncbi:MAG TPA: methyltransferase domain-containing protein, partial [Thermoanaerobaculia bacterium]|nr:methyltransferase domain-containing protein [Thermoanaerobaculia bacterium]